MARKATHKKVKAKPPTKPAKENKQQREDKRTAIAKKKMLEALEACLGVVTTAAKIAGIDRSSHYRWCEDDAEYKKGVEAIDDVAVDFAESQLHKQIQNGEVSSTIFFLKTKGKKRGYVERSEVEAKVQVTIPVTAEELAAAKARFQDEL